MTGSPGLAPILVVLAALAFWAYCLVDFSRTPERDVRTFSRPVWMALLIVGSVVGGVAWFTLGRPQRGTRR